MQRTFDCMRNVRLLGMPLNCVAGELAIKGTGRATVNSVHDMGLFLSSTKYVLRLVFSNFIFDSLTEFALVDNLNCLKFIKHTGYAEHLERGEESTQQDQHRYHNGADFQNRKTVPFPFISLTKKNGFLK